MTETFDDWTIYAPRQRKNNQGWLARRGKQEVRTKLTDKRAFIIHLMALDQGPPPAAAPAAPITPPAAASEPAAAAAPSAPPTVRSFAQAVRDYATKRELDLDYPRAHNQAERDEIRRLNRLAKAFGDRPVSEVATIDLIGLAQRDLPQATGSTRNREIVGPARAVVRFAAKNERRAAQVLEGFRERTPERRGLSAVDEERLLDAAAAAGRQHYLLALWFLRMPSRATETIRVRWDNIELDAVDADGAPAAVVHMRTKGDEAWTFAIHDEVLAELRRIPEGDRVGPLFAWSTRSGPRYWLAKWSRQYGLPHITPHQLRRTVARNLDAAGIGLDDIANVLGHKSLRSTMIYVKAKNLQRARAAINATLGRRVVSDAAQPKKA